LNKSDEEYPHSIARRATVNDPASTPIDDADLTSANFPESTLVNDAELTINAESIVAINLESTSINKESTGGEASQVAD